MAGIQLDRRNAARREDPQLRGRRAQGRASILLGGSLEAINGRERIDLLEVSLAGARIKGRNLPEVGRNVILKCGQIDAFGTIVWASSNRRGIAFDEPISTAALIALRVASVSAERTGTTPEERQAMADWANGLAR